MKRKIIQIRNSTQLISLPRGWCLNHNVKKGDELDVDTSHDCVTISTQSTKKGRNTEIDITGMRQSIVWNLIIAAYRAGADELTIKFSKPTTVDRNDNPINIPALLQDIADRLTGMEIVKQTKDRCMMKAVAIGNPDEIDPIINRLCHMLLSQAETLEEANKNNDREQLKSIYSYQEKLINRQADYCLRMLNKHKHKDYDRIILLYDFVDKLENMADDIADLAESLSTKGKASADSLKILTETVRLLVELRRKFSIDTLKTIHENKVRVKYSVKESNQHILSAIEIAEETAYLLAGLSI